MYLSRLMLNPRSRDARRDAGDPYEMHSTLMRVFAHATEGAERMLFRVEWDRDARLSKLLIPGSKWGVFVCRK